MAGFARKAMVRMFLCRDSSVVMGRVIGVAVGLVTEGAFHHRNPGPAKPGAPPDKMNIAPKGRGYVTRKARPQPETARWFTSYFALQ
jgi:hypothetical protein